VQCSRVTHEKVITCEVGSTVSISVGDEYRERQDAMQCRKSVSKGNACNAESRCIARRTLAIVSLLQMPKGVGSLGNEVIDFDDNVCARCEEGSIARDTVEMQGAAPFSGSQGRAGGNVCGCEAGSFRAGVG